MKRAGVFAGVWAVLLLGWAWTARWTSPPALRVAPEVTASPAASEGQSTRPSASGPLPGDPAARIRGQVRDAQGPVAGARVLASAVVEGETLSTLPCGGGSARPLLKCRASRRLADLVLQRAGEAPVLARATTGPDGAFRLEGLAPGPYALWVESPAGVALRHDVLPGGEDVALVLEPGVRVSGRVSGEDKAPVAGALVTAIHKREGRFFEAVSDATGHFALEALPRGEYGVVITREGRVPEQLELSGYLSQSRFSAVLEWPRRLSGVVLREGVPVVGATVRTEESSRDNLERRVLTDAQGRFSFDDLLPRTSYDLEATHEGAKASLSVESEDLEEPDAAGSVEPTPLTLELEPTVGLSGSVRDTAGRPLEAARVSVSSESLERSISVHTDAQGHYAVEGLAPGTFQLEARAGHLSAESPSVEVREGTGRMDLVLPPATVLSGLLVDEEERPVVNEILSVTPLDSEERWLARSGQDGRFSFTLSQAGRYRLKVKGHVARSQPDVELTAPGDVRVRIERLPEVRGEVVDETDLSLPNVEVSLWSQDPSEPGWRNQGRTDTDTRGRFTLVAPAEGTYRLTAEFVLGLGVTQTVSRRVVVGPRGVETRLRLEEGHALSGVVVDSRGQPVEDARVEILTHLHPSRVECGETRPFSTQWTGPDGRFHFPRFSGEDLSLTVSKEGFEPSCREQPPGRPGRALPAGTREVRATLVREAVVRGRLVRADGTPVEDYRLNGLERSDPQGHFSWTFTCAGPLTLELSDLKAGPGAARLRRTVSVQEERDLDLGTLVLEGKATGTP